jgi:NAD-dependent dihydropyrimidine dehydrogenase PreA subunit
LPIGPNFRTNRIASTYENLKVWKDSSNNLRIYGTDVAANFDLCIGDGACIEVCPVNMFDWQGSDVDRKTVPVRERDCIYCFGCKAVCPKFAIKVTKP